MKAKMFNYLDEMEEIYKSAEIERTAFGIKVKDGQKQSRITELNIWYMHEAEKLDNKSFAYAIKIKKDMKKAIFA